MGFNLNMLPSVSPNDVLPTGVPRTLTPKQWQDAVFVPNVRAWGAKGDGATNDTAAFLAAIGYAQPFGGRMKVEVPAGTYLLDPGMALGNVSLVGPDNGPFVMGSCAMFLRNGSGDFIIHDGSGSLRNILVYDTDTSGTRTGAALKFIAVTVGNVATSNPANLTRRAGYCHTHNVRVSSSSVGNAAWERIVDIDGSLYTDPSSLGVRSLWFWGCSLFGGRTVDSTIRIKTAVHVFFMGAEHVAAPVSVRQGIEVLGSSEAITFAQMDCIATLTFRAGVKNVTYNGLIGNDAGSVSVTIENGAQRCAVYGMLTTGTVSNLDTTSTVDLVTNAGRVIYMADTASLKVQGTSGANLGLTVTATACQLESLNALPLVLKSNGTEGFRVENGKTAAYGVAAVTRPALSYSRSGAGETAAVAAIRTALASLGWVQDSTTA